MIRIRTDFRRRRENLKLTLQTHITKIMIVRGGTTLWRALRQDWPALLYFSLLTVLAEVVYEYSPLKHTALPGLPLGVLITALSLFLAFQVNQCYGRWWGKRFRSACHPFFCSQSPLTN